MTDNLEKEIVEYQKMEKQLEAVTIQLMQMQAQKQEMENAMSLIEKTEDDIYRAAGSVFVKVNKEEALKDLKEKLELIELKIKTLKEQEEALKNKVSRITKKLQEDLSHVSGPGEAA